MLLAAAAGLTAACQKQEMVMLDMSQAIAPVMHDIDSAGVKNQMIITAGNQISKVTFTWDAADFGVKTQVDYSVEVAVGDGPKHVVVSGITTTDASNTYEAVNQVLFNGLELKENVLTDVNFYVGATVGSAQTLYSEPVVVKVSCTAAEKQYPKIYVVGEFNGWNHGNASYLFDFAGDDAEYQGVIDFGKEERTDGGFKITPNGDWNAEWGLDADQEAEADETVLLTAGGSNINIYQLNRYYHFSLDKKSGTLKKNSAFNSVSIIGDATGGWEDGKDVFMEFDPTTQKFWADVTLAAGTMKFRADTAWTLNWGVATEGKEMNKGTLDGDKNITVPAGNYRVFLNLNNLKEPSFVLNAEMFGADVPDVPGNPELSGENRVVYCKPSSSWMGEGITLAAWIWPTGGNGSWYEMADEDGDGFYEVEFPKEYDNIIFASMNGDMSWDNKTNQTADLVIPADGRNAYLMDSDSWTTLGSEGPEDPEDPGDNPGGPELGEGETIAYFKPSSTWLGEGITFHAWIWSTGGEGSWYDMSDPDEDGIYEVTFPDDLGNIIFTSMKGTPSWDNKQKQTADLVVPTGAKNVYVAHTNTWETLADAKNIDESTPVELTWYLVGAFNGWATGDNAYKMTKSGDWYVFEGFVSDGGDFKLNAGTWDNNRGATGDVKPFPVTAGKAVDVVHDGQDMTVAAGTYDVYMNAATDKVYVMPVGQTPAN